MLREWKRETDNGAVHVMGNGRMAIYGIGPELIQIVGEPYSAESFGGLSIPSVKQCTSERLEGTAIWRHRLDNGSVMTDLVDSASTCFVRQIEAVCDFKWCCRLENPLWAATRRRTSCSIRRKVVIIIHLKCLRSCTTVLRWTVISP